MLNKRVRAAPAAKKHNAKVYLHIQASSSNQVTQHGQSWCSISERIVIPQFITDGIASQPLTRRKPCRRLGPNILSPRTSRGLWVGEARVSLAGVLKALSESIGGIRRCTEEVHGDGARRRCAEEVYGRGARREVLRKRCT